jgi:hypothetical protein
MTEPRCFMRYGNAGNLYRTCNANFGGKEPPKEKAKFVPLISQSDFVKEVGRPYTKMSSSQKEAYHRLASARAMRDRREEERKQASMNKKEYKEYIQSLKKTKGQEKENVDLFKQKEKETKQLQKLIKEEGKQLSNKEDIEQFIQNEVIPDKLKNIMSADFKEKYIKDKIAEKQEKLGSLNEAELRREAMAKGNTLAGKKSSMVDTPVGKLGLRKIVSDFGIKGLQLQAGLNNSADGSIKNAENLFKILSAVGKLNYSTQTKKILGPPDSYSGYRGLFNKLVAGKVSGPPTNTRGLSAEDKKKREKIQERIDSLRDKVVGLKDEKMFDKKVQDVLQERQKEIKEIEKSSEKDFGKFKKEQIEGLNQLKNELIVVNQNSLTEMRNIAKKQGFDEDWIKKNINLAIDEKTGRPNARNDLLTGRLIRAKKILENLDDINKKLKSKDKKDK